jgi:hypothetical protein
MNAAREYLHLSRGVGLLSELVSAVSRQFEVYLKGYIDMHY